MGRQKQQLKKPQILGLAGVGVALAVIITIGALIEDDQTAPSAAQSSSPSSVGPPAAPSASPTPSPSPTASASASDSVLTGENNEDFAALLASTDTAELAGAFAHKYQGRTVRYDGVIAAINNHDDAQTRYDILVPVGDDPEKATAGPNFQFRDVNLTFDLHLTGDNVPGTLAVGDKLAVTAEVVEYNDTQDLLLLDPVETRVR